MRVVLKNSNEFLGAYFVATHLKLSKKLPIEISWGEQSVVENFQCRTSNDVARALTKGALQEFYGKNPSETTEVDHWLTFALGPVSSKFQFFNAIQVLDQYLGSVTYLANKRLTIADFVVFAALFVSKFYADLETKKSVPINVLRWFKFIAAQNAVKISLNQLTVEQKDAILSQDKTKKIAEIQTGSGRKAEGKFIDLPGAEMGKVVVRFPPEASGYLHIGHAKAALLNQYYQENFQGKLIMRFDDTNPAKENPHFEKVILEDVAMLEIKPDRFTHTSQYFDLMIDYCEKLLKTSQAYVDDTEAELMKLEREQKRESKNRNLSVEDNLKIWQEMLQGTEIGQKFCVRAKIDMQSANGCLRDPTIYRCKNEEHPRTGKTYKVYPTYDFACPIVDAIEGVTHTLRTMEYHDRDAQFYWFIDALGLRKPFIWEYSRLSMTNTVLSKRKLTWFVEQGLVDGWDDPRMPTVRGVLRRGMTVQGLKEFIVAQGSSRSVVFMEWDKIWAINKKVIDPIAPRYSAVDKDHVEVFVEGVNKEEKMIVQKHPKNKEIGTKEVWISARILIDRLDADLLREGENATFINWGNLLIKKIHKDHDKIQSIEAELNLSNKDYKKTVKLTWLARTEDPNNFTLTYLVYFDHLISKNLLAKDEDFKKFVGHSTRKEVEVLGDPELKHLKKGDIIQIQRKGFFRVDIPYEKASPFTCRPQPVVLFYVPDGSAKENLPFLNAKPNSTESLGNVKIAANSSALPQKSENSSSGAGGDTKDVLIAKVNEQGDVVRELKSKKAEKAQIDEAVKKLLECKAEYKRITGEEFPAPGKAAASKKPQKSENSSSGPGGDTKDVLIAKVNEQGNVVRELKSKKAEKTQIDEAVKKLLECKAEYKRITGEEFPAPGKVAASKKPQKSENSSSSGAGGDIKEILTAKVNEQGNVVRDLKSKKAEKAQIDEAVKNLLECKAEYKRITGEEFPAPGKVAASKKPQKSENSSSSGAGGDIKEILTAKVNEQGNVVRELKSKKAEKAQIDEAVKKLLECKAEYKRITGEEFPAPGKAAASKKPKETGTKKKEKSPSIEPEDSAAGANNKKQTRLGLEARKEENLSDWYSQVITKGEMIEYYDVSGCYIFRPWSYAIWDVIKEWLDGEIKKLGVQNCYFPIFVSKSVLEKEKTHIADFAPEVAWVTKSGDSELAEPIAVRPTSETVMYPAYAKWIQSYRDLPIKLNQWNNVVRWEFKHPQPFLRTREFLWQEGHSAFATKPEADREVETILDLYAQIYEDLLAIPVIKGRKTEKEKFAGGDYTLTVEAFISASGRAIQGATSHHLGQNFSRMFEIVYEDPETQEKRFVYQNSWGITTRTIGVLIMVHADNQGLVLPPKIASIQVVLVPCGLTANLTENAKLQLHEACNSLENSLNVCGIRVKGDYRLNYSPGWKFNHWELKGVPIRIELGPKDLEKNQFVAVRRDTGEKITFARNSAGKNITELLDTIQSNLFNKAKIDLESHKILLTDWTKFGANLDRKNIILAPFCGDSACEDKIKADSARDEDAEPGAPSMGAKTLCIPLEQPEKIKSTDKCIYPECKNKPKFYTLFGRSY